MMSITVSPKQLDEIAKGGKILHDDEGNRYLFLTSVLFSEDKSLV